MSEQTTELARKEDVINLAKSGELELNDIGEMMRAAKFVAESEIVPQAFRRKPQSIFVAWQSGAELGFKPMQALNSIAVIQGRATMYSEAMTALVLSKDVCVKHKCWWEGEGDNLTAHIITKRKGMENDQETTFSMQDAKTAGLTSNATYKKYPKDMLMAKAKARNYRLQFADILKGMRAYEEMVGVTADKPATSTIEEQTPPPPVSILSESKPPEQQEPEQKDAIDAEFVEQEPPASPTHNNVSEEDIEEIAELFADE